ncbi:MAG: 4-demethylwyosine synthase TYW1 [Candidatus Bathyarchaeia archaeon]
MEGALIQPITPEIKSLYYKQGYRLAGKHLHSAVKICQWTKESLRSGRVCYKELWYPPVQSHRCMQMTPYIGCNCHCLYCWRVHSGDREGLIWREFPLEVGEFDEPAEIIEELIERRKELLSGWKGNPRVDRRKFEEALKPTMMTMSLTGEPTLYPRISELIVEAGKRNMITFLVTNGTMPEVLENMDPLPFQLYVSVPAPDKSTYLKIVRPLIKDAWERLNRTLELLPSLETRRVLRFTVIKGWNTMNIEGYAKIVEKAKPDFIEVKAYEWVGQSRERLPREAMPYMEDIEDFSSRLANLTGYEIKGRYEPSGAILLC